MRINRKALIASAVAMALSGTAYAGSVKFDVNGSAGPNNASDQFIINSFDWVPGNLLITSTTPVGAATDPLPIYSQGLLGTLIKDGADFSYDGSTAIKTGQLTYQMRTWATAAADGSAIVYSAGAAPLATPNLFEIYYHTVEIANDVTGCGFGANQQAGCGTFAGTLIYRGTADIVDSTNLTQSGTTVGSLDQSSDSVDVDGGITTRNLGLGTLTLDVDTLVSNPTFFLTDISSLTVDMTHVEQGGGTPFLSANPSDFVRGVAPDYGADGVNNIGDGSCGAPANNPCDVHLQSDASTIVNTQAVPEPQSLALLGLGLAALGVRWKRRAKRFVA